ncbi:MAG: 3-phosphoshikimate 1-carboxyvinyltransferase [Eubacterium sp.]|nr:3-phosphoshikimate 1-carboxyvinyltransferase [Eubacterium sp.]
MKVTIATSLGKGHVHIPPSKSMAHRAIICASLAKGRSVISNVAYSKDIRATIEGMKQLGAHIEIAEDTVTIDGIANFQGLKDKEIFCNESGSTLRFFIPIFSLCEKPITFTGSGRLLQRPQKVYEDIFHEKGLAFQQDAHGIHIQEALPYGEYQIKGDVSSQFISGLLFTLPLLEKDSTIHILPPFESRSYVELTLQMLEHFGVHAYFKDEMTLAIPGGQTYQANNYEIEGDYSQLAFFAVYAAIHGKITVTGVSHASRQGDKAILEILKSFGARIEEVPHGYTFYKSELKGTSIDLANCPDLGPILCVLGMYSLGNTHIYNAGRLRIKESDRIAAMEEELRKFGVTITSTEDEIFIQGGQNYTCKQTLHGHNDHRIVMALSVATACSNSCTTIEDAQAITKSYPTFFDDFAKVQEKVESL